jgi:hypothetical protein
MPLTDSLLVEANRFNIWIAARTDRIYGSGTPSDPYNGSVRQGNKIDVVLSNSGAIATANTEPISHGYDAGDMVAIADALGDDAALWNGTFAIHDVTLTTFKYTMAGPPQNPALGSPTASLQTIQFDRLMRELPGNLRIQLGPGEFQTRGYSHSGILGFQPKTGQKIVGAGVEVTTIKLVGATQADEHYHAVGMKIEADEEGEPAPLDHFELSDLTIDCNLDQQPRMFGSGYAPVACGAVRILGNFCKIQRVRAINWGTKTELCRCFVISLVGALGQTDGEPIETVHSGIEGCTAIEPSRNSRGPATVLHVGGRLDSGKRTQGFARGPYVRKNFVDCSFKPTSASLPPVSSHFLTADSTSFEAGVGGIFVGKREHGRKPGDYVRIANPKFPTNRWNGYFRVFPDQDDPRKFTIDMPDPGTDDHTLIAAGTEFVGISMGSCSSGVVEDNQIHHTWIGGPCQGFLDAATGVMQNLDSLNCRGLTVRNGMYKDVAVGPYWAMGGLTASTEISSITYNGTSGLVSVTTAQPHRLWHGARVKIETQPASAYDGLHEITPLTDTTFTYELAPGLQMSEPTSANYRTVSGVDFLRVEGNVIELADLDETEFAIKEYPLAASPIAQTYRARGIIVGDNQPTWSGAASVHGWVIVRNNKIYYVDGRLASITEALLDPAGSGVQLAGVRNAQVSHNIAELNPRNPLHTFRCGPSQFFNNRTASGVLLPGLKPETQSRYDELETEAEDALLLSLFNKKH